MKKNWIVIYHGKNKGDSSRSSVPCSKVLAVALFETSNDGEYLVKIKRQK